MFVPFLIVEIGGRNAVKKAKGKKRARDPSPGPKGDIKKRKMSDESVATRSAKFVFPFANATAKDLFTSELIIHKKKLNSSECPPEPKDFIVDKDFIAIWIERSPAKSYGKKTVWETDAYFIYLRQLLLKCGWTEDEFVVPSLRKRCNYRDNESRCEAENDSHYARHMVSHLPDGIGYYAICPACKIVSRRTDMFKRHEGCCRVYPKSVIKAPEVLKNAFERNVFLR